MLEPQTGLEIVQENWGLCLLMICKILGSTSCFFGVSRLAAWVSIQLHSANAWALNQIQNYTVISFSFSRRWDVISCKQGSKNASQIPSLQNYWLWTSCQVHTSATRLQWGHDQSSISLFKLRKWEYVNEIQQIIWLMEKRSLLVVSRWRSTHELHSTALKKRRWQLHMQLVLRNFAWSITLIWRF